MGLKKRSYYLDSGVIEIRNENLQHLTNQLQYQLSQPVNVRFHTDYSGRNTGIKTPFRDSSGSLLKDRRNYTFQNVIDLGIQWKFLRNLSRISYGIQQNLYSSESTDTTLTPETLRRQTPPNDNGNTVILSNQLAVGLGLRDSLQLNTSATRLQYNTPDSLNFDDRDEVHYQYTLRYWHLFSHGFSFRMAGEVMLAHYAYLFTQRSAENYWNRIFRLSTTLNWKRRFWRWNTTAEVVANYYDYDYDQLLAQIRSLAFRHMIIKQQFAHPIFWGLQGQAEAGIQLEEQGRLSWQNFLEELVVERELVDYQYQIVMPFGQIFRGSGGYRYQRRIDWQVPNGTRKTTERIYTQGPVFKIIYLYHNQPVVVWEGSLMRVRQMDGSHYRITQIQLQAFWRW